jgi:molybdate transport system permease protein
VIRLGAADVQAILVSLRLAATSTVVLLILGTPLAYWLARTRSRWRAPVEALTALPLVLPPTVLGFYLLVLLGPSGPIGGPWERLGGDRLVFSFAGLVIGSVLFSLPFVVQPVQNAFIAVGERPLEMAATLRASPVDRFFSVALPQSKAGLLSAGVLAFAHTLGEFGVVLMLGGNIPGRTQVVSIALYNHVEAVEYPEAHVLGGLLLVFSFAVLLVIYARNRRFAAPRLG